MNRSRTRRDFLCAASLGGVVGVTGCLRLTSDTNTATQNSGADTSTQTDTSTRTDTSENTTESTSNPTNSNVSLSKRWDIDWSRPRFADISDYLYLYRDEIRQVDPQSGETQWTTTLDDEARNPLAHTDEALLIGTATSLYSIDQETGAINWRSEVSSGRFEPVHYSEAGVLLCGLYDSVLRRVNPDTGEILWEISSGIEGRIAAAVTYDSWVYFGTSNNIYRCDVTDGSEFEQVADIPAHDMVVRDSTLYQSAFAQFVVYDLPGFDRRNSIDRISPVTPDTDIYISDDVAYISTQLAIVAIDLDAEEVLWRSETESEATTGLSFADGRLWVGTEESVQAISATEGTRLFTQDRDSSASSLLAVDTTLLVNGTSSTDAYQIVTDS